MPHLQHKEKCMTQKIMWAVINKNHGKLLQVCQRRQDARELKAMCGGKEQGIAIIKYVLLEEIR